ncbi:Rv3654c family TadE-like protein [Sphaerisporangium sp. NPDC051011]|uniref:Rv3654c family TadE-like protein n=1 Tax=Sphaerisporangium sp. NPDC051011 TaxID=3155792 RepID=UPI0033F5C4F0
MVAVSRMRGGFGAGTCRRAGGRHRSLRRVAGDRGSATVWVVGAMALVWLLAGVLLMAGVTRVGRHRAQSAADLSALAGASQALAAPARACRLARDIAHANGATVSRCAVDAGVVDVSVVVPLTIPWAGRRSIVATSRAGPR